MSNIHVLSPDVTSYMYNMSQHTSHLPLYNLLFFITKILWWFYSSPTTSLNNTGTRGSTFSLGVSWVVGKLEDSQLLGIANGDTVSLALGTCSFVKNMCLRFLRNDLLSGVSTT